MGWSGRGLRGDERGWVGGGELKTWRFQFLHKYWKSRISKRFRRHVRNYLNPCAVNDSIKTRQTRLIRGPLRGSILQLFIIIIIWMIMYLHPHSLNPRHAYSAPLISTFLKRFDPSNKLRLSRLCSQNAGKLPTEMPRHYCSLILSSYTSPREHYKGYLKLNHMNWKLSRSENKDGEHLDTIPTMAKSTFTTGLGD